MLIQDSKTGTIYTVGQVVAMLAPLFLFGILIGMLFGALGCDSEADATSQVRRDQLSSDLRSYTPPGTERPIARPGSGTRSGLTIRRFNSITVLAGDETDPGSITLTAIGSIATDGTPFDLIHRVNAVELVDGVATCLETGETLEGPHLVGADLRSGLLALENPEGDYLECAPADGWEAGSYSLYVGA